jgi:hypothetical protein
MPLVVTVYKPPPKRNNAYPMNIAEIIHVDGWVVETFLNHLLNEKDSDDWVVVGAGFNCFLFFDISTLVLN